MPDETNTANFEIEVNRQQTSMAVSTNWIVEIVRRTLSTEEVASASVGILVVDHQRMHELNRQYLNHDYPTDVLSFPLHESSSAATTRRIEGEIIISAEMAVERCAEFDHAPHQELALYLIHGLLHLCGYDDHDPSEKEKMTIRQFEILERVPLAPASDSDYRLKIQRRH